MIALPLLLAVAIVVRIVGFGATVGDALALIPLLGLYGYEMYLASTKEIPINDTVKEEVREIRNALNSLKLGRTLQGR